MSLALYRTYRPGRFDDVIGQEHVTEPLKRALANDRVHHAYLFSGPRGCGKTSSARILARSLNCEQGPTPEPCGVCPSCTDLAPNGPGSLDVVELDAATHGLVDDARELREKAIYSPVSARYKIYIIDEAHQLGPGAANALLKLIEEPPPHLRFVFATTEPDKIIGTIKSRTHHYAFRLVPVKILQDHLVGICTQEGVVAEAAALALVARAAAGSVRDALSILGQLLAGSGDQLTYAEAMVQLGVTDTALLDEVVDALAQHDGAALFGVIEQVVSAGHDPRRFATDLLERLRDLVVLAAVPSAAEAGLFDLPQDIVATMVGQAERLGLAQLSRAADLVSEGISALRGATAPRLQLELLAARLLLPGQGDGVTGVLGRIDRLERRLAAVADSPRPIGTEPAQATPRREQVRTTTPAPAERPLPGPPAPRAIDDMLAALPASSAPPLPGSATTSLESVRSLWPAVLEAVKSSSRIAWMLVSDTVPISLSDDVLVIAGTDRGRIVRYASGGGHDERLRAGILDVLRADLKIEFVLDPGAARKGVPTTKSGAKPVDDSPRVDDPDLDPTDLSGVALIERELGGRSIGEFENG